MPEQLITFRNQNQALRGMLHLPATAPPFPGVVLFHGFTGQRSESHFIFVKTARALAEAGVAALRFDFRGSGESEGMFADMTIEGEIADGLTALRWLRERPEIDAARVGILGLSLGGCVAACVAGRDGQIPALVLWAAVADLPNVFLQTHDDRPPELPPVPVPGGLDVGGLVVGQALIEDVARVQPAQEVRNHTGSALIVHGTADPTVPPGNAEIYLQALAGRAQLVWIEGADHTFSRTWWEASVIGQTVAYFVRALAGSESPRASDPG